MDEIADDLISSYGDTERASGQKLDRCLDRSINDLWKFYNWEWVYGVSNITTVSGILSYNEPSDFDCLVSPARVDRFYAYPQYGVPTTIPDGANGEKYEVVHDRVNGKIIFAIDPGDGSYSIYYRKKPPEMSGTISGIPSETWIRNYLSKRTAYYYCGWTPDWANDAKMFYDESERIIQQEKTNLRRGQSRQSVRTPLNVRLQPAFLPVIGKDSGGWLGD